MSTDVAVELHYDDAWHDITGDVRTRQDIAISRGRRDWAQQADPSRCRLQINNADGRYSPRNPDSPLYGLIGRNTPLRVRVGDERLGVHVLGEDGSHASTPDSAALHLTGDLDVRVEAHLAQWETNSRLEVLADRWGNDRSWQLTLGDTGWVRLSWSEDGATPSIIDSEVSIPVSGRAAVRATLQLDDGTGQGAVRFYYADTIAGPWTEFASSTGWSATTLHAGTEDLRVGAPPAIGPLEWPLSGGVVHAVQVRDGIDGPVVAGYGGGDLAVGDTTFTGAAGETWTLSDARIVDLSCRFAGEVVAWPPRWDVSGQDVWVPIEAAGIRRRLAQGDDPLSSPMRRAILDQSTATPVAYWPCEDGSDATTLASGLGGPPMTVGFGTGGDRDTRFGGYDGFAAATGVAEFSTGSATGHVSIVADTGELSLSCLMHIPDGGVAANTYMLSLRTSGTAREWAIEISPEGNYRVVVWDWDKTSGPILEDGWWVPHGDGFNGKNVLVSLVLTQNGSDVDYEKKSIVEGESTPTVHSSTLSGHTIGHATEVGICTGGDANGTAIGHVSVRNTDAGTVIWDLAGDVLAGWWGEQAHDRIDRLCREEDIPVAVLGTDGERCGIQHSESTLDLLDGAAESDLGILSDGRDQVGLVYRPRYTLYNQRPVVLDYAAGHLSPPFEPTDDDQNVVNDVTVSRTDGGSHRAVDEDGPLSIQAPPDGVGRYDTSVDLSLASDGQALHQAGWRLHLGTVDEARYPSLTVDLVANPQLVDTMLPLAAGDRVQVANLPSFLPPGAADMIVQGYTETLNAFVWRLTFNCVPASPWTVGIAEDDVLGRCDTLDSTLDADFAAGTDTAMTVSTTAGPPWVTDSGEFPFDITTGGVVLRATGITGTGWAGPFWTEGFEDGITGWSVTSGGTVAHDTTVAHSGSASLRCDPDGTSSDVQVYYSNYDQPVTPGEVYEVEAWVRAHADSAGIAEVRVNAYFNTAAGDAVATIYGHRSFLAASVWRRRRMRVTAPDGAEVIRVAVVASGESIDAADAFWIDDVTVTEVAREPQTVTVEQTPVNGVTRTVPAGAEVRLAHPMIVSL